MQTRTRAACSAPRCLHCIRRSFTVRVTLASAPGELAPGLARLIDTVEAATGKLAVIRSERGVAYEVALAPDFMELMGATAFVWIWVKQASAAARALASGKSQATAFHEGKIATARFVIEQIGPRGAAAAARIAAGNPAVLHMSDDGFG